MSAVTASLCSTLMLVGFFVFVSADQKVITVKSGQDVTLTCRLPNNNIRAVKWSRNDLESEYVLLYQDEQFDPDNQHPSFINRVDLQDRQMKDGDVSLILKNVTINDAGAYECRVYMAETRLWNPISIIYLSVPPDPKIIVPTSGQHVTLTCRAPGNKIKDAKWFRADLETEYVFLYQDGHFVPDNQHPSFKNRVDLQDRQMKDGDVSLILKDVTPDDDGAYECRVYMEETRSWKFISIIYLSVVPPEPKILIAKPGQDVTLTCRAPNDKKIIVVEWIRDDLGDKNIHLHRDGHFAPATQHPSFKNRVDLQDRQMKDGDVSLILKNMKTNDTGTYACHVIREGEHSWKFISVIKLSVPPDGKTITAESGQTL